MRRWSFIFGAVLLCTGLAGSVRAQESMPSSEESANGKVLGSVTQGNTTVVFEAANSSDIQTQALATWDDFAAEHPAIYHALAYKPSLMDDPGYLSKHPELSTFFQVHPEVRDAMAADPGNFAAIPPRPGE
jgi:hypothetical protein